MIAQTSDSILVDTLKSTFEIYKFPFDQNFVAISALPEKKYLKSDLKFISESNISTVITLVEKSELESYGLADFFDELGENKLHYFHFPIQDYGVPTKSQMDSIFKEIVSILGRNENILIHCKGGLGRSGTVMASFMKNYINKSNSIEQVRQIRGEQAIETRQQEQFVLDYVYEQ